MQHCLKDDHLVTSQLYWLGGSIRARNEWYNVHLWGITISCQNVHDDQNACHVWQNVSDPNEVKEYDQTTPPR